ncbi:MAG TPA: hypothetical protein VLM37_08320, partial [Fibrobacteraceae bacterium]|nr:hypothetical protein [Fibrobacteraceae bacterium]
MTQPLWKGFGIFLLGFTQGFPAVQIPAEVPSMDSLMNPTASTAIASPVVWWERPADQSGVWGRTPPSQIDDPDWGTLLSNQELPIRRWAFPEPGIRIQVGNEVGDYLLQEAAEGPNPTNRTPTIETWVASPIWHGAQAFAELRQVDHFGEALRTERAQAVGSENMDDPDGRFAWFGENYPGYSSLRGGLSLQGAWGTGNLMVGQEYLWLLGAGDQWYGIKSQRI